MENLVSFIKSPKIIFVILAAIILIELVLGIRYLSQKTPPPAAPQRPREISGGSIVLAALQRDYQVGENIAVKVRVSTGGHSSLGTDLVLRYDPTILEASSSAITVGKIYNEYPMRVVDEQEGLVKISGIGSLSEKQSFNGSGIFATINFRALKTGKTNLLIDYTAKATNDSNIINNQTNEDILEEVGNLDLNIQ